MACATGRCLQSLLPLLCVPLVGAAQLPPCRRPTLHPGRRGLGCRKPEGSHRSLARPQLPTHPHPHPGPLRPLLLPGVSSPFLPSPLSPSPLLSLPALACVPPGTCSEPLLCARPGSTRPGRGGWDAKLQHTHTHTTPRIQSLLRAGGNHISRSGSEHWYLYPAGGLWGWQTGLHITRVKGRGQ